MKRKGRLSRKKVTTKKHRLTLGEALDRIRHKKIYSVYSIPPIAKRWKSKFYKQIEGEIKMIAPKAKIEYMPKLWLVKGHVKDPFQDIKVSNITAGEAFLIAFQVMPQTVTWKG